MARRAFLNLGYYQFLRETLGLVLKKHLPSSDCNIVDLGCGEGYYTSFIRQQNPDASVYGIDISKDAIRYAAKHDKSVHYSVGTNAVLPLANRSAQAVTSVFSPVVISEVARILRPDGLFLTVSPGMHHLLELKQKIYDDAKLHAPMGMPNGFELIYNEDLEQQISLADNASIGALLDMTPFSWKVSKPQREALLASAPLELTLSFDLKIFKPLNSKG
ncbi:MAG: methyltransferase domain-containing protein [Pseudomonadota bacterium]